MVGCVTMKRERSNGSSAALTVLFTALALLCLIYPAHARTCSTNLCPDSESNPEIPMRCLQGPCPENMCYVPAGEFIMGADEALIDGIFKEFQTDWNNELNEDEFFIHGPERQVYVGAFCMDMRETTNREYEKATAQRTCSGTGCGRDLPVAGVTWEQAKQYCEALDKRLPLEEEWEKAARGAQGGLFPWGGRPANCDLAVMPDAGHDTGCGRQSPWPAGSKPDGVSPYGILDLAGNVAEWTTGCTGTECNLRVLRGGSWNSPPWRLRAFFRRPADPDTATADSGFRCAWSAAPPIPEQTPETEQPPAPEPPRQSLKECIEQRRKLDLLYYALYKDFSWFIDTLEAPAEAYDNPAASVDELMARVSELTNDYADLTCNASDRDTRFSETKSTVSEQLLRIRNILETAVASGAESDDATPSLHDATEKVRKGNSRIVEMWVREEDEFQLPPMVQ